MNLKSSYNPIRQFHLYLGLFVAPFLLIFGLSILVINHDWSIWGLKKELKSKEVVSVSNLPVVTQKKPTLSLVKSILQKMGITGEIGWYRLNKKNNVLFVMVRKPGVYLDIDINLSKATAEISKRQTGFFDKLVYLHMSPGPHNNWHDRSWSITKFWWVLVDFFVYALMFIVGSGLYMWLLIKTERKAGLFWCSAGFVTFFSLVYLIA